MNESDGEEEAQNLEKFMELTSDKGPANCMSKRDQINALLDEDLFQIKYNLDEFAQLCDNKDLINLYNYSRKEHVLQSYQMDNGKQIYMKMHTPESSIDDDSKL